ncbi:hypothetical protein ACFT7S_19875 [Streptomyces sp. NPDC057136]|uniref:hypothetical protein n=1 Tax=Streptomyces sp. NPDC057136 TaxID=3346029 RepID=UPI00362E64D6
MPSLQYSAVGIDRGTAVRPCTTVLAEPTSGEVHDWPTLLVLDHLLYAPFVNFTA